MKGIMYLVAILFVVGYFVGGDTPSNKPSHGYNWHAYEQSESRKKIDKDALVKQYYAAQVIRCYQMSDSELASNYSFCRDVARRARQYGFNR